MYEMASFWFPDDPAEDEKPWRIALHALLLPFAFAWMGVTLLYHLLALLFLGAVMLLLGAATAFFLWFCLALMFGWAG